MGKNHIVLTGADGFIGRHFCRKLSENRYVVTALILPGSPLKKYLEPIKNVRVVETDFAHMEDYADEIESEPEAFVHLAWSGVAAQKRNLLDVQMQNINLSLAALKLSSILKAKKFIMPGSTMEYAYADGPINGKSVPTPQNLYGAIKIAARYICQVAANEMNVPFIYTVLSGIYSEDRRDGNVIYYTIDSLLDGKKPSLTLLKQKWDYIYIDDLVTALMLVCQKGLAGKCYAIGRGDNMALKEYIEVIHNLIDPSLPLGIGEIAYKNDRLPQSCIDLSELAKDTGFEPKISFKEGIQKVICAMKFEKFGNTYRGGYNKRFAQIFYRNGKGAALREGGAAA